MTIDKETAQEFARIIGEQIAAATRNAGVVTVGEIEKTNKKLDEVVIGLNEIRQQVAVLDAVFKVKSGAWGAIGGSLVAALTAAVFLLLKS